MTTQSASGDNNQRWSKLLRRAFEIPDIITDDNGDTAIAHALRHGFDTPPAGSVEDAKAVVAVVIELGGLGELDELFMFTPDRADRKAALIRAVAQHPPLLDRRRVGPLKEDPPGTLFDALIDAVFAKVTRHVSDHPFGV
jgi:hypothetical protein